MNALKFGENVICPVTGNTVSAYYTSDCEVKGKVKRMTKSDERNIKKIHINKIYTLARGMRYNEFESEIAKLLDDVQSSAMNTNEYYVVNEKNLPLTVCI